MGLAVLTPAERDFADARVLQAGERLAIPSAVASSPYHTHGHGNAGLRENIKRGSGDEPSAEHQHSGSNSLV